MKTIILKLSYLGYPFCGFARQPNTLTIQGNLEDSLRLIFNKNIDTTCAGRTDSGVHAKGQVVSFCVDHNISNNPMLNRKYIFDMLNKLTHPNIRIFDVEIIDKSFSARFDAKERHYSYFICNQINPPFIMNDFCWHIDKILDIDSMKTASKHLIGEHDFKSFCVTKSSYNKPTSRRIFSIDFSNNDILDENIIEIKISGNAFLHSMVRTIVGSLVEVGLSKKPPEWINEVINAKDRRAAGICAPAKGLIFMDVIY